MNERETRSLGPIVVRSVVGVSGRCRATHLLSLGREMGPNLFAVFVRVSFLLLSYIQFVQLYSVEGHYMP